MHHGGPDLDHEFSCPVGSAAIRSDSSTTTSGTRQIVLEEGPDDVTLIGEIEASSISVDRARCSASSGLDGGGSGDGVRQPHSTVTVYADAPRRVERRHPRGPLPPRERRTPEQSDRMRKIASTWLVEQGD